ncbi:hypothetical protein SS05631_c32950 [Sinorhizobium sp. CCBAU 05631]|nr:hypothetical protein SS05631_c32950 [Sinorhizobium sp. CCBAU 05631]
MRRPLETRKIRNQIDWRDAKHRASRVGFEPDAARRSF